MVQNKPETPTAGAMGDAESKNLRSLCILRHKP
jgi:hypothetical protein